MRQVVSAINYIHSLRIIHRDLKLDNILVKFEGENDKNQLNLLKAEIKIIDFGFAAYKDQTGLLKTAIGSPMNMDPLILKKFNSGGTTNKELGYDEKADIWSLGTLCYQMLIGNCAFDAYNMKELVSKIEEGTYKVPTNLSKEVVSFLNAMLQYKPEKRLSASELIKHAFLIKNVNDFTRIDINKISKKVYGGEMKINIRENNTIWSIFNEEDEQKLINIPGELFPSETPISESQYLGDLNQNNANNQLISKEPFNIDKNFIEKEFKPANSTPIDNNFAFGKNNSGPIPEEKNVPNNPQIQANNPINQQIMKTPLRQKNPMPIFQNNINNINNNYISKTPERPPMPQQINSNNMITFIKKLENGQILKTQIPLDKFKEMQQNGQIGNAQIIQNGLKTPQNNIQLNQMKQNQINKIIPNNLINQMNAMINPPVNLPHGQMQFGVSPHFGVFQNINNNQNPNLLKFQQGQIQRNNTTQMNILQNNLNQNNIALNNQNQKNLLLNRQMQNNPNINRKISNNQIANNIQNINRQIPLNIQNNQNLNKQIPNNLMKNNMIPNNFQNKQIPKNNIQNAINMSPQNRMPLAKISNNNISPQRIINNSDLTRNQKNNIQLNQLNSKPIISNNPFQKNQLNQKIQNGITEDTIHKAITYRQRNIQQQQINRPRSPLMTRPIFNQNLPQNTKNQIRVSPQRQFQRNQIISNQEVQQIKIIQIPNNRKRIYSGNAANTFTPNMIQNPNNNIKILTNMNNNGQIQRRANIPITQQRKLNQMQLRLTEQNSKNHQNIIATPMRNCISPFVQRIGMNPFLTFQNNNMP